MECDFGNEETKAELEARLKACTNILDDSKFLMVSEAHEGIIIRIHTCVTKSLTQRYMDIQCHDIFFLKNQKHQPK